MKILLYGVLTEENFGGPSLLHGVKQLIHEIDNNADIVCYQSTKINEIAISDFNFPILRNPYKNNFQLLYDGVAYKFGRKPKNKEKFKLLKNIKDSDIVADLFGICFCSDFNSKKMGRVKAIKSTIGKFSISFIAKLYKTKTVKCPASYGPIKQKGNSIQARIAAKYIFDVMVAREKESYRQMKEVAKVKKEVLVSPDLANLMPYNKMECTDNKYVSISVSYQIIKQWNSSESYIQCIVKLINYITSNLKINVVLIPNEVLNQIKYNDIDVANDIYKLIDDKKRVSITDVKQINSTDLKSIIASSEMLIGSRYHSCVAALSAGVPTLVVGWHYKYDELLKLYNQEKWIISNESCNSKDLITIFKNFYKVYKQEKQVIEKKHISVREKLVKVGKKIFSMKEGEGSNGKKH